MGVLKILKKEEKMKAITFRRLAVKKLPVREECIAVFSELTMILILFYSLFLPISKLIDNKKRRISFKN